MTNMTGFCYSIPNEYIMRKLLSFVERQNTKLKNNNIPITQYTVFGFYFVSDKKMDFRDFKFKQSKYYVKYLGKVPVESWKNNKVDCETSMKTEISNYCFKLQRGHKKGESCYWLHMGDKKYEMKYSIHLLRYFYTKEKEFFEKDYNLSYIDDIYLENNERVSTIDLDEIDNEVMSVDDIILQEVNGEPVNKALQYEIPEDDIFGKEFNFNSFYQHYFPNLTLNYQKIIALLLLGVRITDISRLMNVSQPYLSGHIKRIGKRIDKIYNQTHIEYMNKE